MALEEDALVTGESGTHYSELVLAARHALPATLFWLALPVLGEQFLASAVGLVDTFIAGRISRAATIAVGLASYVNWFAMLLSHFLTAGTHALVARHWGAADVQTARRTAMESIRLALFAGATVASVFYALAPSFASLQGLTGETHAITVTYLRVTAFGQPFTTVFLVAAASLRAAGDMKTPMFVNVAANVLNAVASWFLAFGVAGVIQPMGVAGIAVGTVCARVFSAAMLLALMGAGLVRIHIQSFRQRFDGALVRRILRIGVPAALEGVVMWCGQMAFLTLIGHLAAGELGEAYYAAHVVGIRIESLTYLPAVAWGAAGATLVGQFLGAGMLEQARRAGNTAATQGACLGTLCGLLYFTAAEPLYRIMHRDPLVWQVGVPAFKMLALFQPLLVIAIVYVGCLRGAGETREPLAITTTGVIGIRLPLAYVGGIALHRGLIGAWSGMCADILARAALAFWAFRRGRWTRPLR